MNKTEFDQLHKTIIARATRLTKDQSGHEATILMARGNDLFAVSVEKLVGQTQVHSAAQHFAEIIKPDAIFIISETWLSSAVDPDGNQKYKSPSDDPNRIEALVILAENNDGEHKHSLYEIKRRESSNKIKSLDLISIPEVDSVKGRLTNLISHTGEAQSPSVPSSPNINKYYSNINGYTVH